MDAIFNTTVGEKEIIIKLHGRLDTLSAPAIQEEIGAVIESKDVLILDFSDISYVSSAGLRVLLFAIKKSEELQVALSLRGVSPEIKELFEMTGFNEILNLI